MDRSEEIKRQAMQFVFRQRDGAIGPAQEMLMRCQSLPIHTDPGVGIGFKGGGTREGRTPTQPSSVSITAHPLFLGASSAFFVASSRRLRCCLLTRETWPSQKQLLKHARRLATRDGCAQSLETDRLRLGEGGMTPNSSRQVLTVSTTTAEPFGRTAVRTAVGAV